jgi:2-polyprenyl-3-methyl-5-hydroxy-6-metoxy-1,4-benzoquinol methylase
MKKTENLNDYQSAYQNNFKFNDENHAMLKWYADKILKKTESLQNLKVLSLGIGHNIVSRAIANIPPNRLKKYVIVEGAKDIINDFVQRNSLPPSVKIINSFFETFESDELFDIIEMGFVLEHVDDPLLVLNRFKAFLYPSGSIYIAVPNAKSLHRIIGQHAGLLNDIYQLSEHDLKLGHKRYFDLKSITSLIMEADLNINRTEGIYLKPFTTDQLQQLNLSSEVEKAIYEVGCEYPEISNSIFLKVGL